MAFFEELGRKAKDVAAVAADKAKDVAAVAADKARETTEKTKISVAIAGEQREIEKNCRLIGEWFINEYEGELPEGVQELADFVSETSKACGFGEMGSVFLGGGSDAGFIQRAGTPVICSIGVQGQFNHSDREYALVESMFTRAKLLAAVISRIDEYEAAYG